MKKIILTSVVSVSALIFSGCADTAESKGAFVAENEILGSTILSQAEQSELTPELVFVRLGEGNADYVNDSLTVRNNNQRIQEAALGQYPMAVILSCLDSRVPVEDVFHCGIGDLFVARVAGNIINEDILGSMEFACKVSGAKLVLVLGHDNCGAIRSAIQRVELGNITELLAKIQPAVDGAAKGFQGETSAANPEFVEAVCNDNVLIAMEQIRRQSPILKGMEDSGEIMIVGGVYDLKTGKVEFFSQK